MIYTLTHDDMPLLSQWIKNRQVETCRFLVRVTGEVVSASSGRRSEQNEAPRSTSETRQCRVVGHRKSEGTVGLSPINDIQKQKLQTQPEGQIWSLVRVTGLEPAHRRH